MSQSPEQKTAKIAKVRSHAMQRMSKCVPSLDTSNPASPKVVLDPGFQVTVTVDGRKKRRMFDQTAGFTLTSKMSTFSFSLPALHPDLLGSCPAQAVILQGDYVEKYRVNDYVQRGSTHTRPKDFICNGCYAAGGRYGMSNVVLSQMARYHYVLHTLETRGAAGLADDLDRAIKKVYGRKSFASQEASQHFRIHDSGDFFSLEYLAAWIEVCNRNPGIMFWAPIRIWTQPGFMRALSQIPSNLIARPSALQFEDPAPMIDPLPLGSTSSKNHVMRTGLADWECPAYAYGEQFMAKYGDKKAPSCGVAFQFVPKEDRDTLSAMTRKPVRQGEACRVCWEDPDVSVSYRKHTDEERAEKRRKKRRNPPAPDLSTMFDAFQKGGRASNPGDIIEVMSEFGSALGEVVDGDTWSEEDWDRFAEERGLTIGEVGTAQEALASWLV